MATKKKAQEPQIIKGSHLTVTVHPNGKRDLVWDDEALKRDVQAAIESLTTTKPAKAKKPAKIKATKTAK